MTTTQVGWPDHPSPRSLAVASVVMLVGGALVTRRLPGPVRGVVRLALPSLVLPLAVQLTRIGV
jgi:hypothetical protein